jgi:hypothetical protein
MATAVALVLLDVVRGHVRGETLAWLALLMVSFSPVHVGFVSNLESWSLTLANTIPIVLMALVVLSVLIDISRRRLRVYKLLWIGAASITSETYLWGIARPVYVPPDWLWQLVLVTAALALALGPLNEWSRTLTQAKTESPTLMNQERETI